jgi:hypothetical protein
MMRTFFRSGETRGRGGEIGQGTWPRLVPAPSCLQLPS